MSEYKGIKGFQVTTRTEDPTPYAQALADNPYVGSWSSGGSLNTARNTLMAAGTRDANLAFAGEASGNSNLVELYNGTSWSEQAEVNTAVRGGSGAGSSTSAIKVGGYTGSAIEESVESWNGSAWSEIAELNTDRQEQAASGASNTSSLVFGGVTQISPGVYTADTETWNGSAWTEVNELNGAAKDLMGNGTATSALAIGGYRPPGSTRSGNTESWNGTSWTEVNEASTARTFGGASGSDNTNALVYAGDVGTSPASAGTESWDGTNWTEVADLSVARYRISGSPSGTSVAALATGGLNAADSNQSVAEEWAFSGLDPSTTPAASYADAIIGDFYYNSTTGQFKNVTSGVGSGTWASAPNMNTGRYRMQGGMGVYNNAFAVGGANPPKANVENFDGTSWSEVNDLPSTKADVSAGGTATAGIALGGQSTSTTFEWDGTNFSTGGAFPVVIARAATFGTQTAFVAVGGASSSRSPSDNSVTTLEYDGSSWTTGNNFPTNVANGGGSGILTSGMVAGGAPSDQHSCTYDGTNWTQTPNMNSGHTEHGFGQQSSSNSSSLHFGAEPNGVNTEEWDGTAWTETNNLSTGRSAGASAGDTNNAIYAGGLVSTASPTNVNTTEEWSQSDFQIKSVTTS